MSHERLVVGWVGAPLPDAHLNETVTPWPSHEVGLKNPFNPQTDGPRLDQLRESEYITHFGGNAYNAAVANSADSRFDVHMLWGKGKSEQAREIEEDMTRRDVTSHPVFNLHHENGGSFVKAMDGDRGIVTMPRTPLHETVTAQDVHDFLRVKGMGAIGISSLKSSELNAILAEELDKVSIERAKAGMEAMFSSHNPGSGEFTDSLLETWKQFRHTLIIGNKDEFNELYGKNTAKEHALNGTEYADVSVCSDGIAPMQIAYAPGVVKDSPRGGTLEVETMALQKWQVVDSTGAGDRLTSVFTSATHYAQKTGELTVGRLVSIGNYAAQEAGQVIQHIGGHGDKPYPYN